MATRSLCALNQVVSVPSFEKTYSDVISLHTEIQISCVHMNPVVKLFTFLSFLTDMLLPMGPGILLAPGKIAIVLSTSLTICKGIQIASKIPSYLGQIQLTFFSRSKVAVDNLNHIGSGPSNFPWATGRTALKPEVIYYSRIAILWARIWFSSKSRDDQWVLLNYHFSANK